MAGAETTEDQDNATVEKIAEHAIESLHGLSIVGTLVLAIISALKPLAGSFRRG